jgi:hypothetical protein
MYTTFHLQSAKEINKEILDFIKSAFKNKPIVITVEEEVDDTTYLLSSKSNKSMLMKSIAQDKKKKHKTVSVSK